MDNNQEMKGATEKQANWSNLPNDILLHILSFLSVLDRIVNAAAVCHSWREAAADPTLSRTLDLSSCRHLLNPIEHPNGRALLDLVFVRGINLGREKLTKLVFNPLFCLTNKHLMYAAPRCQNLQEIELPFLYKTTTKDLRNAFRSWKELKVMFVAHNTTKPGVNVFGIAAENCPHLNSLRIGCFVFSRRMVACIGVSMPRLKSLTVRCSILMPNAAAALLRVLPDLEEFYLRFHMVPDDGDTENLRVVPATEILEDPNVVSRAGGLKVLDACYENKDWWIYANMIGHAAERSWKPRH